MLRMLGLESKPRNRSFGFAARFGGLPDVDCGVRVCGAGCRPAAVPESRSNLLFVPTKRAGRNSRYPEATASLRHSFLGCWVFHIQLGNGPSVSPRKDVPHM